MNAVRKSDALEMPVMEMAAHPDVSATIRLIEREMVTLRRNVENDLIAGLHDKLHRLILDTLKTDLQQANHMQRLYTPSDYGVRRPFSSESAGEHSLRHASFDDGGAPRPASAAWSANSYASSNAEERPYVSSNDDSFRRPPSGLPDRIGSKKSGGLADVLEVKYYSEAESIPNIPNKVPPQPPQIMVLEDFESAPKQAGERFLTCETIPTVGDTIPQLDEKYPSETSREEENDAYSDDELANPTNLRTSLANAAISMQKIMSLDAEGQDLWNEQVMDNKVLQAFFVPVGATNYVARLVRSDMFDYAMSAVLILNSIVIGLRVDYEADNLGKPDSIVYVWIDRLFCIIFVSELCLRLYTFRLSFYISQGWGWAYFDTVIVAFQVLEEVMLIAAGEAAINIGFLKMLKMGRLARMVRMVRLLPELKSLVLLILASMSSFIWTCVLLLLLVYMLSVYMVMMAVESLEKSIGDTSPSREELRQYWGSVGSAILSLYWSISGGQDWAVVIGPLVEQTGSQVHNIVFSMFIAFATMVLMNLVTGVFVEGAARLTKEDRDKELSKMAHKVFRMVDDDCSEEITREEFDRHLSAGGMDSYLQAVDLDRGAADNLFEILDSDKSGTLNVNEFVDGCLRMRGLPKSADITQLLLETRRAKAVQKHYFGKIERTVEQVRGEVRKVRGEMTKQKMRMRGGMQGVLYEEC